MTAGEIDAALTIVDFLVGQIEHGLESLRGRGELTPEQDADFEARKNAIWKRDYAQPSNEPPPLRAS